MSKVNLSQIEKMIYVIRGQKVMLDRDLAALYEVETKLLNQAVKRNPKRFPQDFSFVPDSSELRDLRSQIVTLGEVSTEKHFTHSPRVFTENGVAMLSSVLKSEKAIEVNIAIMRIFTKLRSFLLLEKGLETKVENLEQDTQKVFRVVFERLDHIEEKLKPHLPQKRRKIGLSEKD